MQLSIKLGQPWPAHCGDVVIERVRVPEPHDLLQLPHVPTAQLTLPHGLDSTVVGQAAPLYAGCCVMGRVREVVQAAQALHAVQLEVWQSTGQGAVLHGTDSSEGPLHGVPPFCSVTKHVRERLTVEPPQVTLQLLHADQSFQTQSIGQALRLHDWTMAPHPAPPHMLGVTTPRV